MTFHRLKLAGWLANGKCKNRLNLTENLDQPVIKKFKNAR
jgi:hypothetical protein